MNESNDTPEVTITQEEKPHLSPLQRLIGVFSAPKQTLEDIAIRPSWVLPFILTIVITIGATHVLREAIVADFKTSPAYDKLMENDQLTVEQVERARDMQITGMRNFAAIGGGIATVLAIFVVAAILLFVGNVVLGGTGYFKQTLAIFCWSGLIGTLGYILQVPISLQKLSMKVYFSPAAFMSAEMEETALFKIAAALDVFVIWRIIVLAMGFAAIYKFSMNKSLAALGGLYALFVLIVVVSGGLF
ncbi:hypothetical protein CEE37_02570 [candidate division LCP-89 bacterium B3_LCP]|uniref:Yip1 domain-containing protein n=1 Tax=candidate division LCP-89 bacterium B3_LCP TaxID=2012998 RepID=A0A532V2L4_UNCL8|nr:MAG: hypothetical protein CEE37_02570 [candidate division LCP-89 bacterium B3_LCP]